jgi:hypothetical protein
VALVNVNNRERFIMVTVTQIILASGVLIALFIFFLVISRSVGAIDNMLYKMEYMVRKDCDIRLEALESRFKLQNANKRFEDIYGPRLDVDEVKKEIDADG